MNNESCLEAHAAFFRLLMNGIFDQKVDFIISNVHTHDYTLNSKQNTLVFEMSFRKIVSGTLQNVII